MRGTEPTGRARAVAGLASALVLFALPALAGPTSAAATAARPVITKVSTFDEELPFVPGAPEGPAAGGTEVLLDGEGFGACSVIEPEALAAGGPLSPRACEDVLVYFGEEPGLMLAAEGDKLLVFAPAHAPGSVDVTVSTPGGMSPVSASDQFTYTGEAPPRGSGPAPAVTGISRHEGPAAGFSEVTVQGSDMLPAGEQACIECVGVVVRFGSVAVPVLEGTQAELGVVAPPHAAGMVDVTVTTPEGTSAASEADRYRYVAPPPLPSPSGLGEGSSAPTSPPARTSSPAAPGHHPRMRAPGMKARLASHVVVHERAKVLLGCPRAAPGGACRGTLTLTMRVKRSIHRRIRRRRQAHARVGAIRAMKTLLLARAGFVVGAGTQKVIVLRLRPAALAALGHARDHRVRVMLTVRPRDARRIRRVAVLGLGSARRRRER